MKLLLDMNLSPALVPALAGAGHSPTHRSAVGDPRATDRDVLESARLHGQVVVTHDLDFGALLASSGADGPSVLQFGCRTSPRTASLLSSWRRLRASRTISRPARS